MIRSISLKVPIFSSLVKKNKFPFHFEVSQHYVVRTYVRTCMIDDMLVAHVLVLVRLAAADDDAAAAWLASQSTS